MPAHKDDQGRAPEPRARVEGDVLVVTVDCQQSNCCGVDFDITVPATTAVDLKLGTGDASVDSIVAPVNVDAGTGEITLTSITGNVVLRGI